MRSLRDVVRRTRSSLLRLVGDLNRKVRVLEEIAISQDERLSNLELGSDEIPSMHAMELQEYNRKESELLRRSGLSESDLRSELETQYGRTDWAKSVIDEIVSTRGGVRH